MPIELWGLSALVAAVHVALALVVSAHIVLTKSDVRAAIGWVGLDWVTPLGGPVTCGLFGGNRIRPHADRLHRRRILPSPPPPAPVLLPRDGKPPPQRLRA